LPPLTESAAQVCWLDQAPGPAVTARAANGVSMAAASKLRLKSFLMMIVSIVGSFDWNELLYCVFQLFLATRWEVVVLVSFFYFLQPCIHEKHLVLFLYVSQLQSILLTNFLMAINF
jgi:hypothetical protein